MEDVPYWRILREGWLIILAAALIGAGVAYGIAKTLPETFAATSTLLLQVDSTEASLFERNQFSLARIKTYPLLVDSPEVIDGVRDDLDLSEDEYSDADLRRMLNAETTIDTVLVAVRADAPTPALAADLANSAARNLSLLVESTENSSGDERYQVNLEQVLPAVEPTTPVSPQVLAITGLGLIAGFALGAIVAVYRTTTNRRLSTISDVRRASGLPVVGRIPRRSRIPLTPLRHRSDAAMEAAYADAVDNLTTLGGLGISRLVLVPVSARGFDDHDLTGLLDAYQSAGRRVCVLDARSEVTDGRAARSLAELLDDLSPAADPASSDRSDADRVIYALSSPIPAARLEREIPGALVRLGSEFDIVLLLADAGASSVIETATEAGAHVVLSVRRNSTSATDLLSVATRLRFLSIRPIGVLITGGAPHAVGTVAESWRESDRVESAPVDASDGPDDRVADHAYDEPGHDEPADDEPADDEPADDEPADDEPADDEPGHDEPVRDAAEESVAAEPAEQADDKGRVRR